VAEDRGRPLRSRRRIPCRAAGRAAFLFPTGLRRQAVRAEGPAAPARGDGPSRQKGIRSSSCSPATARCGPRSKR
jgi:hypothetical protein